MTVQLIDREYRKHSGCSLTLIIESYYYTVAHYCTVLFPIEGGSYLDSSTMPPFVQYFPCLCKYYRV